MHKKFVAKAGIAAAAAALLPLLAFAAVGQVPGPIITTPTDIAIIIQKILNYIGGIIMTIAVIMLLWSAVLYLTAGGSATQLGRAKNYLIYAIVGIVVAILAFSVQPFLETVLRGGF